MCSLSTLTEIAMLPNLVLGFISCSECEMGFFRSTERRKNTFTDVHTFLSVLSVISVMWSSVCSLFVSVTFLSSAYNTQTLQNNSIYPDLLPDERDMLYSAYGDETGVQCALRSSL